MAWGVQTWDANGNPNNYGIKPVSVYGSQLLTDGQNSGTWTIPVPSGLRLNFYHVLNNFWWDGKWAQACEGFRKYSDSIRCRRY